MSFPDDPNLLTPWLPSREDPWNRKRAGHLLRRAGFGATRAELEAALESGPWATLDRLFAPVETGSHRTIRNLASTVLAGRETRELAAWWLRLMVETPDPLREKCAVVWHGHFAVSDAKVASADLMYDYYTLLHDHGAGDLRKLARGMIRNPAMLVFLDADANRKGHPNENLARELFELFLLGLDQYTESDIQEAARALTGLRVKRGRSELVKRLHDDGPKTIFGQTRAFRPEDVIDLCFEQPACARHLARRLAAAFVHPDLPDEITAALAERLRECEFHAGSFLRWLLGTRLFYHPLCYRARVKTPVELAIGAVRSLETRIDTRALGRSLAAMGQQLFVPPGVQGWPGGDDWISSGRMVARNQLAESIASRAPDRPTPELIEVLLDDEVPAETRKILEEAPTPEARLHLILTLPESQLA